MLDPGRKTTDESELTDLITQRDDVSSVLEIPPKNYFRIRFNSSPTCFLNSGQQVSILNEILPSVVANSMIGDEPCTGQEIDLIPSSTLLRRELIIAV